LVWYDDPIIVTAVIVVIIAAIGVVVLAMKRMDKKPPQPKKIQPKAIDLDLYPSSKVPFAVSKSVQSSMATSAKDELRTLGLEQEILGDAIRRLYEACAENKITQEERDRLASYYTVRMNLIKESISKDEGIVALHELEGMQEDLMKLFSERFGELSSKVEALRTQIDVKPIREIPIKVPRTAPTQIDGNGGKETGGEPESGGEETDKPKRNKPSPKKTSEDQPEKTGSKNEAERRIETISSEVESILNRLEQIEFES
jgi:hypothetical protein